MKMLLGSALTLALVIPSGPANAELLKNLKLGGGVDLQATSARNVTDFSTDRENQAAGASNNDRLGTMMTRTWAGLGWDLLDDVHAKITLRKNDRAWGTVGGGGQQVTADAGSQKVFGVAGNTGALDNLFVQEANIKIDKLMGHLDSTLGRQFWGESGDLIAFWGPKNTYGLFVTAIDALAVQASNDWMNFMGVAGKTTGNAIGTTAATVGAVTDRDVRGIDVAWKMLPVKVNTFLWNAVTHGNGALGQPPQIPAAGNTLTASGVNDNLWVYGAKVKGEAMGGWVSATVALNAGTNRVLGGTIDTSKAVSSNYIGKALLFDAGYKLDVADVGGFTPWVTWGWGSGQHDRRSNHNEDFQSIASDFRPGVIYGRFSAGQSALALGGGVGGAGTYDGAAGAATAGLTNRIIWGGGLKFNCARHEKATLGLAFWDFNYQKATRQTFSPALQANTTPAVGNRHIGSEFDLTFDWAHSENVMLSAGWATFQPGGFIKETIRAKAPGVQEGNSPVNMLFADLSVKF